MSAPVRPPLHAPPVHTMGLGHLPLAVVVTLLISSLFAAAFGLGYVPPLAAVSLLVLLIGFAVIDWQGWKEASAKASATGGQSAGTRFTIARLALACLLAGVAASRVEAAPELMLWSLAAMGFTAALLDASDGWLARITGSASDYSARLSGLVSCVLTLALALLAWQLDRAGVWVVLAAVPAFIVGPFAAGPAAGPPPAWRAWAGLAANALLAATLLPVAPVWSLTPMAAVALILAIALAIDTLRVRRQHAQNQNTRISGT